VNKKFVLALFVVGVMALGLLIILLIGVNTVDEDGRENDAPPIGFLARSEQSVA
jgi:uncharacterized membrane protein (Fun14 family)